MLKNKKTTRVWIMLLILIVAFGITGCGKDKTSDSDKTAADGSLQRVLDNGKLVVACETAWPPFAYIDPKSSELTGFDVEVAKEVANRLGVKIEFTSSDTWDGIVATLDSKRCDAIFNGVNIAGRVDKYAMTIPYMQNQLVLTVAADNDSIKSFEDLKGKLVANALEGSNGKLAKSYGADVTPAGLADAMMLLRDHRADAQIEDQVVMARYLDSKPEMKKYIKQVAVYEPKDVTEMQVAGMFRMEDKELVAEVDKALQSMKEDGFLYELGVKYLGQDVADSLEVLKK